MEPTAETLQAWREIAAFFLENLDDVYEAQEEAFVREYPRARANVMDVSSIRDWTKAATQEMIECLQTGDLSEMTYLNHFGDVMEDPFELELTLFSSHLSSMLFFGRTLAPLLFRANYTDGMRGRRLINAFERFIQEIVSHNCDLFAREMSAPRMLSRGWQLMDANRNRTMSQDSPASRRMTQERYNRIVKNMIAPAEPQGSALTRREREVLVHVVDGYSNAEIAHIMGIAENTVKKHVSHIFDKYNVYSRAELIARTREQNR